MIKRLIRSTFVTLAFAGGAAGIAATAALASSNELTVTLSTAGHSVVQGGEANLLSIAWTGHQYSVTAMHGYKISEMWIQRERGGYQYLSCEVRPTNGRYAIAAPKVAQTYHVLIWNPRSGLTGSSSGNPICNAKPKPITTDGLSGGSN